VTRALFVDPVGGAAGDMLLAALLDAGAPRRALEDVIEALDLRGVRITTRSVTRMGMRALHVDVRTEGRAHARPAAEMRARVADARALDAAVRRRSLEVLDRLIQAEARVHGVEPSAVVLHELGGDDTIVDICGVVALLVALRVDRLVCAALPLGTGPGSVGSAHGSLPVPAPATVELLRGAPVVGVAAPVEFVTPTAAAIVATLVDSWELMPAMTLEATGTGAGTRELADRPNVCRVLVGIVADGAARADHVVQLEANVDDMVPELVPDVLAACLAAGALDAWAEPIHMKKGRPGLLLCALARPEDQQRLAETLLRHATTLGVRVRPVTRYVADRVLREVTVDGHVVRVKIGLIEDEVVNVAPEHDDCAAVAAATGRPVKQIWAEALAAAVAGDRAGSEEPDAVAR
jgi:pyridinium-3,5-bisthiocarboxylic acid mononucleotide nickel chelatase